MEKNSFGWEKKTYFSIPKLPKTFFCPKRVFTTTNCLKFILSLSVLGRTFDKSRFWKYSVMIISQELNHKSINLLFLKL